MCKKIYASQGQLSKLENGDKEFPLSTFNSYAATLGISAPALLECLLMANPDEAVEKALHEMNNPSKGNAEKEQQYLKAVAEYWEEKYFQIQADYEKLAKMKGITPHKS